VSGESQGLRRPARRAGALGAAVALLAIGASGCGGGLKRDVDSARALQSQGTSALTQAQQQAESVQSELQQQVPPDQNGGGGTGGYGY
jgi:hypothetical protein